ncbi:hypothetical protein REC12_11675 [Desulfosporosinus sp. PR]|uniref:hypothetical protein n=1 Tax=Candidatus Desulfosporosinus nitrosoreducens TaxID=3401928 RepID=UPI0027F1D6A9|nr:hypothetical protein [Desulfosporosinus sp. PR]MDQ7094249.1 hypothetical protein [Desulfosporosinus sp. PR]
MGQIVLRAKLRKWQDRDIENALMRLKLEQGERSYLVRRGVRLALKERGVLETIDDIETAIERG